MKIQKKHSVALAEFTFAYLEAGYYPVDDTVDESAILGKALAFARYHELYAWEDCEEWTEKRHLPDLGKVARIDLTSDEACAIMDMMAESLEKDIDEIGVYTALRRYLYKEFIVKES